MVFSPHCRCVAVPFFASLLGFAFVSSAANRGDFNQQLDALKTKVDVPEIKVILDKAEAIADGQVLSRAFTRDDIEEKSEGRFINTRAKANSLDGKVEPELALQFGLASGDMAASRVMLDELPLLAAAYRITGSQKIQEYLVRQLSEIVTWDPFQRPGWTIASRRGAPQEGGDGVWLATGTMIQALAITLTILPPDVLPPDVDVAVREAIAREVNLTYDDWSRAVPWYVQSGKANSNQWIVPSSGLVIGSAFLGREKFAEAYELGVSNLNKSLQTVGSDGSMDEGYAYGLSWNLTAFLLTNYFMDQIGDDTFSKLEFFKKVPHWVAMYFQPGVNFVNAFDNFGGQRGSTREKVSEVTRTAGISHSKELTWLIENVLQGPSADFFGLLVFGLIELGDSTPPPLWGAFEKSAMFVWRSSWDLDASGLWVRGGSNDEFHDHHDRGHINFIASGVPILIESGTPGYSHPRKRDDYNSARGHNVLYLGENIFPLKAEATISVERVDERGGAIKVDATACYPELESFTRHVTWGLTDLSVIDTLSAKDGESAVANFLWHFASNVRAEISGDETTVVVKIPAGEIPFPAWIGQWRGDEPRPEGEDIFQSAEITIEFQANHPIQVIQDSHPDHTLKFRAFQNPHTVLTVRSKEPVSDLIIKTSISATVQ